ncbi:unnamed protein product [Spirodela intermedia]|uniref:Uncharacterized protein n=1 Tax=Spirodela intermedia TaxID=51605 RepID=A0A7I8IXJ4_SPIIN|nr:unnamed protein product [Spirodela intermedia]CAA6661730.1 unnamed protein product [Spirodela intermedia]
MKCIGYLIKVCILNYEGFLKQTDLFSYYYRIFITYFLYMPRIHGHSFLLLQGSEMGHPVTRDGSKTATSGALSFQRPGLSSELPQLDGMDGDEPPLNEDDDLDDPEQEEEELNTEHLVLAQFDKVTRAKNKWKCTLKDGIMHINSKDVLFNKASGEFEF